MQKEQTPPHAAAPPTESRLRWGKPKPALANPEKSGGAKLRDYGAETALAKALCSPDCSGKPGETR